MFEKNFLKIRNEYILPLVNQNLKLNEYQFLKIKDILINNFISVENPRDNFFLFTLPKKLFLKATISETEQFYLRSLYQLNDFKLMSKNPISHNWRFTTFYYFYFFSFICSQRIQQNGFFFLDSEKSQKLSKAVNTYLDDPVKISLGNYKYKVEGESTETTIVISVTTAGSDVHKTAWYECKTMINKFIDSSKLSERRTLEKLKSHYNSLKGFSPSTTRNYLNYNSDIGIHELDNKILCSFLKEDNFLKSLFSFNSNDSINDKISISIYIGLYLHLLNTELLVDLRNRGDTSLNLLKKYEKRKGEKIKSINSR